MIKFDSVFHEYWFKKVRVTMNAMEVKYDGVKYIDLPLERWRREVEGKCNES